MEARTPYLRVEETAEVFELTRQVTTVGRGPGVDIMLTDRSVSRLHAEIHRRGSRFYVDDLGLSTNGTQVNGHQIGRRVLASGDVVTFGLVRTHVGSLLPPLTVAQTSTPAAEDTVEMRSLAAPELTRREIAVLDALCRPALHNDAFVLPATVSEIAAELVVTDAAVKQHLLRLYRKFHVAEGPDRRHRLANAVVGMGVVRALPREFDY